MVCGQPALRSVDSESESHAIELRKTLFVGAFAFLIPRATLLLLNGLVQAVLPESKNMSKRITGLSKNLGGPVVSSEISRMEIPGDQLQASAAHSSVEERTQRVQLRYRQAKETKCGGMGGRKS